MTSICFQTFKTLEDLIDITTKPSDTPNEAQFMTQYGEMLAAAREQLRTNRPTPTLAWEPFRKVYSCKEKNSFYIHSWKIGFVVIVMSSCRYRLYSKVLMQMF